MIEKILEKIGDVYEREGDEILCSIVIMLLALALLLATEAA